MQTNEYRFLAWLEDKNRCPLRGSSCSPSRTKPYNPSKKLAHVGRSQRKVNARRRSQSEHCLDLLQSTNESL
jgi:hypothetical protein